MKTKQFDLNKILNAAAYILFIAGFVFLCYVIRTRSWTDLDSDMSSELILAKMLKEEGRILTSNWYYSTELRILYYTQIAAVLFHFTDNWYMVRVCSDIIMLMIYVVSTWCLCISTGLKRYFPVFGLALILPFSFVYHHFVLYTSCYIPYIAGAFFSIALAIRYTQSDNRKTRITIVIISGILALLLSMEGLRQPALFYLPFFVSAILAWLLDRYKTGDPDRIKKSVSYITIAAANLFSSLIGYEINALILVKKYTVADWSRISFASFDHKRFIEALCGMVRNLGYREGNIGISLLIADGYSTVIFLISIAAVWFVIKRYSECDRNFVYIALFYLCAVGVFALLYAFSDMIYYDLYSLPVIVFVFPVAILFTEQIKIKRIAKTIIYAAFAVTVCLVSWHTYKEILHTDDTAQLRDIAAYVTDQGYEAGYGTFWNANVLTELSDGRIDMYNWEDARMLSGVKSVDDVQHWLQKASHDTVTPSGRIFHIYNREELYYCNWSASLNSDDIIYETQDYIIYGYPSYDDMKAKVSSADN